MTSVRSTWFGLLRDARASSSFTDKFGRFSHDLLHVHVSFSSCDFLAPLRIVRALGWVYPSDEVLRAVLFVVDNRKNSVSSIISRQLPFVVHQLKAYELTRRAVLYFMPFFDLSLDGKDMPFFVSVQFLVRSGKLHVSAFLRSVDLLFGFPVQLFHAATLGGHVASLIGLPLGSISFSMSSAYVLSSYDDELERVLGERVVRT